MILGMEEIQPPRPPDSEGQPCGSDNVPSRGTCNHTAAPLLHLICKRLSPEPPAPSSSIDRSLPPRLSQAVAVGLIFILTSDQSATLGAGRGDFSTVRYALDQAIDGGHRTTIPRDRVLDLQARMFVRSLASCQIADIQNASGRNSTCSASTRAQDWDCAMAVSGPGDLHHQMFSPGLVYIQGRVATGCSLSSFFFFRSFLPFFRAAPFAFFLPSTYFRAVPTFFCFNS